MQFSTVIGSAVQCSAVKNFLKHKILYECEVFFNQFHSLYVTVWKQIPEHLFQNLGSEYRTCRKLDFSKKKNMMVKKISGSDKTVKVTKNYDSGFVGWFFFVAIRSHQQPMHGWNLESSLLPNFFIGKDFIVQMFRKWRQKLPYLILNIFVCCCVLTC